MTPEQFDLMKQAARNLLAHRDAGRKCDPHGIAWAVRLLKQNPERPAPTSGTSKEVTA